MHYDVKISGARIPTHDLWIRKRVCYPLHHSASLKHRVKYRATISRSVIISTWIELRLFNEYEVYQCIPYCLSSNHCSNCWRTILILYEQFVSFISHAYDASKQVYKQIIERTYHVDRNDLWLHLSHSVVGFAQVSPGIELLDAIDQEISWHTQRNHVWCL